MSLSVDDLKNAITYGNDEFDSLIEISISLSDETTEKKAMPDELIFLKTMCRLESLEPQEFGVITSYKIGDISVNFSSSQKSWCAQFQERKSELGWDISFSQLAETVTRAGH